MGRKLTAKWSTETAEEWKESFRLKEPPSRELVHYWTTFLMYADLLCGYTHTTVLKRKKPSG